MEATVNVMGKLIKRVYNVEAKTDDDGKLKNKPLLKSKDEIKWQKILSFRNEGFFKNRVSSWFGISLYEINISEDEEVSVEKEVFRADLNEVMLYTSKEISIVDFGKEEAENELELLIKEYNKQKIEENDSLLSYCKLHNLDIEKTDYDDLQKVIKDCNCKTEIHGVGMVTLDSYGRISSLSKSKYR